MFYLAVAAILFLIVDMSVFAVPFAPGTDGLPNRLRREDSFLGIHFDFHAGLNDTQIGQNVTAEMVNEIIDKVHPDYIQIDCKGHPGCSSYPTNVGNRAGGFVGDPLRIWREVTAKRGVSLLMHYSGVWDTRAVTLHPEWAAVRKDGQPDKDKTSVFGPYVDKLLIPQLAELRNEYGVDGYWIDGECWATVPDYNPSVIERFTKETNITEIPKQPSDAYWYEWTQFHRAAFNTYLQHYVDTLHRLCPGVQIASNWAYSSLMPEKVSANVDFLSGDYTMQDSVRDANWQARCLRNQGKPWDLMAWGFSSKLDHLGWRSSKTAEQLQREAAIVLSTGGGFQCYFGQRRDGSVRLWQMDAMGKVAQFCRERQKYCHRAESIPQIALFYNRLAVFQKMGNLYHPENHVLPIRGILDAILDGQRHVDVTLDHHLKGQCQKYPVIVFPEWEVVDNDIKAELIAYVRNGGNLLIIGPKSAELFQKELGVAHLDQIQNQIRWLHYDGAGAGLNSLMALATFEPDVQTIGTLVEDDYPPAGGWSAGSIRTLGKGKIAGIYANVGNSYYDQSTTVVRDFMSAMLSKLLPQPIVEVNGSHLVTVVVNRITLEGQSHLAINLVNMAGTHRDVNIYTFDEIPAVGPLSVRIRLDKKPRQIISQPDGEVLRFTYSDGIAEVLLPTLPIHNILIVKE